MSSSLIPSEGAVGWAAKTMNALSAPQLNGFRLSHLAGTPVSIPSDATTSTKAYLTPHTSDRICLFDGTNWQEYSTSGSDVIIDFTVMANNLTSGNNYDLFVYDSGGTVTFDTPVQWTSDNARATSIVRQNGVWVKSGAATRRFVGTVRATSANTIEDSPAKRYVDNVDNQVFRAGTQHDTTVSWTYTSTSWGAANAGNAAWKREAVYCLKGRSVVAVMSLGLVDGGGHPAFSIGVDSSTTKHADATGSATSSAQSISMSSTLATTVLTEGYHFYQGITKLDVAGSGTYYSAYDTDTLWGTFQVAELR